MELSTHTCTYVRSKSLVVFLDVDDPFDICIRNNDLHSRYAALPENQTNCLLRDQTEKPTTVFQKLPLQSVCQPYCLSTLCSEICSFCPHHWLCALEEERTDRAAAVTVVLPLLVIAVTRIQCSHNIKTPRPEFQCLFSRKRISGGAR